jgi:hypothetical protein
MSIFKYASLAAVSSIALAHLVQPAAAGTIVVTNVAVPFYKNLNLAGSVDGISVSDSGVISGQIVLTAHDQGPPTGPDFTLPTWCVDLFHTINIGAGTHTYNEGSLTTDNNSTNPSALNATQISQIGDLVAYGDDLMATSPSNQNAALVQAAIWTVEYNSTSVTPNNTLTVTDPDLMNPITQSDIQNTINAAIAHGGGAGQLVSLEGAQGLAYQSPAPPIGAGVPGVLGIGALLLGANLASRRKKGRAAETAAPCAAA